MRQTKINISGETGAREEDIPSQEYVAARLILISVHAIPVRPPAAASLAGSLRPSLRCPRRALVESERGGRRRNGREAGMG